MKIRRLSNRLGLDLRDKEIRVIKIFKDKKQVAVE
jgi:hypothetical protein